MKKAIATEELVKWILFFFVLAALAFATVILVNGLMQQDPVEKCRLSVVTRGTAQIAGKPLPINLACYTRNIEIKEDGAYLNRKVMNKFEGDLDKNIKRTIANEMYTCWYQFAKGQYNPFGKWWGVSDSICVICSDISFDDTVKGKLSEVKDISAFLDEQKIPTKDITYSNYLYGDEEAPENVEEKIPTNQKYGVVFALVKKEKFNDWQFALLGLPACTLVTSINNGRFGVSRGCIIGGLLGVAGIGASVIDYVSTEKYESTPALMFIELETVKDSCDRLY